MHRVFARSRAAFLLRACEQVGDRPELQGRPTVEVWDGAIRIGDRFRLASKPVVSHLAAGPNARLEIGRDVSIAHGAAIAAFEQIRIGDGTLIGPFVIIMDTNFHGTDGDQSVQHDCRPVIIGERCRIGSRVTITRGATIGDGAQILAGSVVSSAIPAGACAAGARARVIGRAGDRFARWDSAAAALPEMLLETFGADTNVGTADTTLLPAWNDATVQLLLAAIEARFGVGLDAEAVRRSHSAADLAEAIERAIGNRSDTTDR